MSIYDKASLVLIPSGTKTSKVYSQKPTNGDGDFTFSRSTAATRVNASGNIEKETQNLLLQSNQFDTTWTNVGLALTSGQSGYDGTSNAWKIEATSAVVRLVQANTTSGVQTFSVYAKAGNVDIIRFQTQNGGTDIFFNVNTGSIVSAPDPKIDATIEAAGNGFYRCTLTYNETLNEIRILPQRSAFSVSIGDYIYIQDAQLEQGLVARDYIETTTTAIYGGITDNVPRLDYTDSSCPALLLEPQRTNLVTHSEYVDGSAAWSLPNIIVEDNSITSPEGLQNASKLTSTADFAKIYQQINLSASTTYTASFWVKDISSGSSLRANLYDLTNGTPLLNQNYSEDISTTEWKRLEFEFTTTTACTLQAQFVRDLNNGEEIYVWGFQLEAGSYATSYIPTYGSAVTRNVEAINSLDFQANEVATSATNWTWIVKGDFNGNGAAGNNILAQRDEGGFFYRYGSSLGFSGATKGYWTEFNPSGGFAYIWDGTQLRVRRGGSDIRTISAADIGWNAGGTSNWTINYLTITRISFELEKSLFFNQTLTNEEIDSIV